MVSRSRVITIIASTLAVLAFLFISTGAVVWANGLKFDPKTHNFVQTVLIAVDGNSQDVDFYLNGQLITNRIPYRVRNLLPDHYTVELTKQGFQTWRQSFWLSKGQIGVISDPVLIADQPLTTSADPDKIIINPQPKLDFGLDLTSGELLDHGNLVTRFSQSPTQIHRFNSYYLYQLSNQIRLFLPAGSQDFLVYTASSADSLDLGLYPATWQVAVKDQTTVKLVNLTIPGTTATER